MLIKKKTKKHTHNIVNLFWSINVARIKMYNVLDASFLEVSFYHIVHS
jgi:hypothetical protein